MDSSFLPGINTETNENCVADFYEGDINLIVFIYILTRALQDRLLLMPQVYNISTLLSEVLKLIPLDPEDPAAFLGHPGHLDRNVSGIAASKTRQD